MFAAFLLQEELHKAKADVAAALRPWVLAEVIVAISVLE